MRTAVLIVCLMALCLPVFAVGTVTTDPNQRVPTTENTTAVDDADARLNQKTTLSETRKTVAAILDDLTQSTGIVFKAGYNSNDWQVRDRKMCVFAKDVPLVQVMNSISHVMKFKWERKGEPGKWQYRLYMDRRTLLDADAQKLREDERLRAKCTEKRKSALEQYMNIGNLSDAELDGLRDKDPLLYVFATNGIASSLGQMFREIPAMSDAMAAGDEMTIYGADMSPAGRDGLRGLLKGVFSLAGSLGQVREAPDISSFDLSQVSFGLNHQLAQQAGGMQQYIVLAMISTEFGGHGAAEFPLMNPDSAIGRALGNLMIGAKQGQVDTKDMDKTIETEVQKALPKDLESLKADYGEPEAQHAEDPALKTKVKLKPDGDRLADIQRALADAGGFAVVSDSFGKNSDGGVMGFVKEENELGALLDKLSKQAYYNWDKRGMVIEFRDREWFRKRSAQIPEATLETWRQTLKKTGTLDLPELAQIARLEPEQYCQNVAEDEVLGMQSLSQTIWQCRDILRLYEALNDSQRSVALAGSGLDLGTLSTDQQASVEEVIRSRCLAQRSANAQLTLKFTRKQEGKAYHYAYALTIAGDKNPVTGEFTTPKYEEQKKPADSTDAKPAPAK